MAFSETLSRSVSEPMSLSADDAEPTSEKPAAPSSGSKGVAFLLAMLLTMGAVGLLGYTQWWVPREKAQQVAQMKYEHCLEEVKIYRGKHSYKYRLSQCNKFLGG